MKHTQRNTTFTALATAYAYSPTSNLISKAERLRVLLLWASANPRCGLFSLVHRALPAPFFLFPSFRVYNFTLVNLPAGARNKETTDEGGDYLRLSFLQPRKHSRVQNVTLPFTFDPDLLLPNTPHTRFHARTCANIHKNTKTQKTQKHVELVCMHARTLGGLASQAKRCKDRNA